MTELDTPAIGREIAHEMHNDRPALIDRLRTSPRQNWHTMALAYATHCGAYDPSLAAPVVVYIWEQLVKEATNETGR